jgi:nitroreductase
MILDKLIQKRISVRSYSSKPIKNVDILAICEAARLAPSACNSQTWRFVAVTDRKIIKKICEECMRPVVRNKWLKDAPLIIVGCSRLDIVVNKIGKAITGIEYYQVDLGIAMEHMVLKATELGLGTCWIGWFKERQIKKILKIPQKVKVTALLAVGYSKENTVKIRDRKPLEKILFFNKWGHPKSLKY